MMVQGSEAQPLSPYNLPDGREILSLPGHSFDMAGFRTPDDIVYLADCLSSSARLEKYQISFLVNPGDYIDTLEKVKGMNRPAAEAVIRWSGRKESGSA